MAFPFFGPQAWPSCRTPPAKGRPKFIPAQRKPLPPGGTGTEHDQAPRGGGDSVSGAGHGMRRGAGVLILLFGVYTLAAPGGHAGHDHSAHQPMPQENQ